MITVFRDEMNLLVVSSASDPNCKGGDGDKPSSTELTSFGVV